MRLEAIKPEQRYYPLPSTPADVSPVLATAIADYDRLYDCAPDDGVDERKWETVARAIFAHPAASAVEQALKLLYLAHFQSPDRERGVLAIDLLSFDLDAGHLLVGVAADMLRSAGSVDCDAVIERDWVIIRTGMRLAEASLDAPDSDEFQAAWREVQEAEGRILEAQPTTTRAAIVQILCGMYADTASSKSRSDLDAAILSEDLDKIEVMDVAGQLDLNHRFAIRAIRTLQRMEGR